VTIFDLLFLVVLAGTLAAVVALLVSVVLGRFSRAAWILAGYAVFAVVYIGAVTAVSLTTPPRTRAIGEDRCFDDWCIAVASAEAAKGPTGDTYTLGLRLSSQAGRVSQRENGVLVYLVDDAGHRFFASAPDTSATLFNVQLRPHESVLTTRTYIVSESTGGISAALAHEGSLRFGPGKFIIGDDGSMFHEPTLVRLR
jgi:hypothetical protein